MDSLLCSLQDKVYIIDNVLLGARDVIQNGRQDGRHLRFHYRLIENTINSYVTEAVSFSKSFDPDLAKPLTYYFKIPYVGFFL